MKRTSWLVAIAIAAAPMVASAAPVLGSGSGPIDPPVSIIGGTAATSGEFPTVVGLLIGSNLCTGTLIAPAWVMTAAHCVDPDVLGMPSQDAVTAAVSVHFNTLNAISDPGTTVAAVATFKDPLFNKNHLGANDLGLIELTDAVTDVVPSAINLSPSMVPAGTVVTTVGYGSTNPSDESSVGVEFELTDRRSVSCPMLGIGSDTNLLCFSQAGGSGTCEGDSGGPSFAMIAGQTLVVGVTSFGDSTCSMFGADTRVDAEQPFILQHIPELAGCSNDGDCGRSRTCFAHRCITDPFGPTGLGTVCTVAEDCESLECAESSQDGKRCSFTCSVSDDASCPDGFECLRSTGDVGACWPVQGGGCCEVGGNSGPGALLLGLGVLVVVLRRRR